MQGENLQEWGCSWALQEQWAPQLEALGGCNLAQQQWGHVCQLGQGTALQFWNVTPLLARSCAAEPPEWQELVPGEEFVMLELPHLPGTAKPPRSSRSPFPAEPGGASHCAQGGQAERSVPQSTGGQLRTRVSQRKWKDSNYQMINGTDMNPADSAEPRHLCWDRLTLSPETWELKEEKLPTGKCLNPYNSNENVWAERIGWRKILATFASLYLSA